MPIGSITICFWIAAVAWMFWGRRRPGWDPMAPTRVFGAIWLFAIGVTNLYWSDLQMQWTAWSWVCILGSMTSFLFGSYLGSRRPGSEPAPIPFEVVDEINPKRFVRLAAVLFAIALVGYLSRVIVAGAIPVLAENVEETRWQFYDVVSGSWTARLAANAAFMAPAVLVLCAVFLCVKMGGTGPGSRSLRRQVIGVMIAATLMVVSTGFRGVLLTPLVAGIVLLHYLRKRLSMTRLIAYGGTILCIGLVVVAFRHLSSEGFGLSFTYDYLEMNIPPEYSLVAEPYANVGLSMDNIVVLMEKPPVWTLGLLTFGPIWAAVGLKWFLLGDFRLPLEPAYGLNTATFLYPLYEDFGVVGILILPFIFGWLAGRAYRAMLVKRRLFHAASYGYIVFAMLFSVVDNVVVLTNFWLGILAVYVVIRLSQRPGRLPDRSTLAPPFTGKPITA